MSDDSIETQLRAELKQHHIQWSKSYRALPTPQQQELLSNLKERRLIAEATEENIRKKLEDEPIPDGHTSECGTLMHGTGGGRRVILKGSPFS